MTSMARALDLVARSAHASFVGERPDDMVAAAERTLQVIFPPSYRWFVSALGAGNVGSYEFFGVVDGNFEQSTVPNGVWLTLVERAEAGLPHELLLVGATGSGDYYALDTSRVNAEDQECPAIVWSAAHPVATGEIVAPDFGAFLLSAVEDVERGIGVGRRRR